MAKKRSTHLAKYGTYGSTVRVWQVKGSDKVMVQWREAGERKTKSFRGESAGAQARALAASLTSHSADASEDQPTTMGDLWEAFVASPDFLTNLRSTSRTLYRDAWAVWCKAVPTATPAMDITVKEMKAIVVLLRNLKWRRKNGRAESPYAISTLRSTVQLIKRILNWGVEDGILTHNPAHTFRFVVPKDDRRESPDEYTEDEFKRIMRALPGADRPLGEVTARSLTALIGYQGIRSHAAVHLRWEDIRWDDPTLIWRKKYDKRGNTWEQPMRPVVAQMLAHRWNLAGQPRKGWVFPGRSSISDKPYSKVSLWLALRKAESKAGVEHQPYRAMHGFRRKVAGDVAKATGNSDLGMQAIGDMHTGLKRRYLLPRSAEAARGLKALDDAAPSGGTDYSVP